MTLFLLLFRVSPGFLILSAMMPWHGPNTRNQSLNILFVNLNEYTFNLSEFLSVRF